MKKTVLVDTDQYAVGPEQAVKVVQEVGLTAAAAQFGVSGQTLRNFLNRNGYKSHRKITWAAAQELSDPPELVA